MHPAIPSVDAASVQGELEALRGTPLLVNVWAMWCPPCVAELPDLAEAATLLAARGGRLLAVNVELTNGGGDVADVAEQLPRFLARRDLALDVWFYAERDSRPLWRALGVSPAPTGIPITLALARDGKIVDREVGRASPERLAQMIDAATE